MFAFIGALGLGVAFRDSFTELSTPKKAAIILSYVGAIGSTVLGSHQQQKSICFSCNSCLSCRLFYCFQKAVKKQANNKTFEERYSDKLPSSFYILFKGVSKCL